MPEQPTRGRPSLAALIERGNRDGLWPQDLSAADRKTLAHAALQYGLDPFVGDLTILGGKPYVTAGGLRREAERRHCHGIHLALAEEVPPVYILDAQGRVQWFAEGKRLRPRVQPGTGQSCWRAELKKAPEGGGFVEFGEASFDDVGLKQPHWKDVRAIARTRAVNRVIRLAYAVGLTSVEELSADNTDVVVPAAEPSSSAAGVPAVGPPASKPPVRQDAEAAPRPRKRSPSEQSPAVDHPLADGDGSFAGAVFRVADAPAERADARGTAVRVPAHLVAGAVAGLAIGDRCTLWSRLGDEAMRAILLALAPGAQVKASGTQAPRAAGHLVVTELAQAAAVPA